MSLPTIAPYDPPKPPENRAAWTPDPDRAVLLVHDMQRYFVRAFAADAAPLEPARANIARLAAECRSVGIPVIYTVKPGGMNPVDRGLELDFWGNGMRPVPEDTDIDATVAPHPDDTVLTKWRYSAFSRTDLEARLARMGRDQLLVTGVYAHIGCLLTASDAFMRDVQPFFVTDATADFSADDHRFAADYVARRCGVALTAEAASAALAAPRAAAPETR